MERRICISLDFLTDAHRAMIEAAARETGFRPCFFGEDQFRQASACLQDCEVFYGHSPELLRTASPKLKWYCCSFAGVDPYCREPSLFANPDCLLTHSGVYGVTIAEHVIMVLLMLMRQMPAYEAIMAQRRWENQLPIRSIRDSRFTVLGTGDIGRNIALRLRGMGAARITGVSRSGSPVPEFFDRVLPVQALDSLLPDSPNLILALPGTPETENMLSRRRIGLLPQGALVVNVGRGTALDQEALAEALNSGRLGGAALDVMAPEPLPADHPLWTVRNLILTPHVSGNMTLGYTCDRNVELFCQNLRRYAAGEPLLGLVDRTRGY